MFDPPTTGTVTGLWLSWPCTHSRWVRWRDRLLLRGHPEYHGRWLEPTTTASDNSLTLRWNATGGAAIEETP
jgi:hypothetical protein